MTYTDLLEAVRAELVNRSGNLRGVATASGVPYDTVLRLKNREGDPGYEKVRRVGLALGLRVRVRA